MAASRTFYGLVTCARATGSGGVWLTGIEGDENKMVPDNDTTEASDQDRLRWSADIVAAYVSQNALPASGIPELIRSVYDALSNLGQAPQPVRPAEKQKPAVPVSKSVHEDYIVCLEDGKRLKMLKRYLRSRYDMSPEEYRRKWGLPPDYPMVAPAYAARRSDFAKQIGLGRGVRRRKA